MIVFIISVSSCGNSLSREKARALIEKKYGYPILVTEQLENGDLYFPIGGEGHMLAEESLEKGKLITFEFKGKVGSGFFQNSKYLLNLTPEGEKYKVNEFAKGYDVRVAEMVLIDVTGMVEKDDGNTLQVEYSWKYDKITPFGEAFSLENAWFNVKRPSRSNRKVYDDKVYNETVTITKYDDGWRIQE